MRVLLLYEPDNPHTIRWAKALADEGVEVAVFGFSKFDPSIYKDYNIEVYSAQIDRDELREASGKLSKIRYLKVLRKVREIIADFKPDILHAFFATSYGLLGVLTKFHPYCISVLGEDVYLFPNKSFLHKYIFKYNLSQADKIFSTGDLMAGEILKYTSQDVKVISFGVDTNKFKATNIKEKSHKPLTIGIVKSLEPTYGIKHLLTAISLLKHNYHLNNLELLIVGGGTLKDQLEKTAVELSIDDITKFTGRIDYEDIPKYHNLMDIEVYPSLRESFGVSLLEAFACEKPVIASDVVGFRDIIEDGETGILVPVGDAEMIAEKLNELIDDSEKRYAMGRKARKVVEVKYSLHKNVEILIKEYQNLIGDK